LSWFLVRSNTFAPARSYSSSCHPSTVI
jgi:hypothetical protein